MRFGSSARGQKRKNVTFAFLQICCAQLSIVSTILHSYDRQVLALFHPGDV
jgi:hypothetical protein